MKLIKILFAVILALVIANVTLTNRTVEDGVTVAKLSRQITELEDQNTIMRAQVAAEGSLGSLMTKIAKAGFVESGKIASVKTTSSVASR